jgi:hypothetical protein
VCANRYGLIRHQPPIRCCGAAGSVGHLPRVRCQHSPPWRQRHGRVTAYHQLSSVAPVQGGLTPYQPCVAARWLSAAYQPRTAGLRRTPRTQESPLRGSQALHTVVLVRLRCDDASRAYAAPTHRGQDRSGLCRCGAPSFSTSLAPGARAASSRHRLVAPRTWSAQVAEMPNGDH